MGRRAATTIGLFGAGVAAGWALAKMRPAVHPRPIPRLDDGPRIPPPGSRSFARGLTRIATHPPIGGNRVTVQSGVHEAMRAMVAAIDQAEASVNLEMFWYRDGRLADRVTRSLVAARRRGVAVRLLVDGYGTQNGDQESLARARSAGVEVAIYHPVSHLRPARWNHRTHRRILVCDGQIGMTGGVGIGDDWLGLSGQEPWCDLMVRVDGPMAEVLESQFYDQWRAATDRTVVPAEHARGVRSRGRTAVQLFPSGPDDGSDHLRRVTQYAVMAARRSIRIVTPYFVPDEGLLEGLVEAARRGVEVEVLVPRHTDRPTTRHASKVRWGVLLAEGVRIGEYLPTMLHAKVLLVDDAWVLLGTMNMDMRSFMLNSEIGLGFQDRGVVATVRGEVDAMWSEAEPVRYTDWAARPYHDRVRERGARLVYTQL